MMWQVTSAGKTLYRIWSRKVSSFTPLPGLPANISWEFATSISSGPVCTPTRSAYLRTGVKEVKHKACAPGHPHAHRGVLRHPHLRKRGFDLGPGLRLAGLSCAMSQGSWRTTAPFSADRRQRPRPAKHPRAASPCRRRPAEWQPARRPDSMSKTPAPRAAPPHAPQITPAAGSPVSKGSVQAVVERNNKNLLQLRVGMP
jgi:hypothetical protein